MMSKAFSALALAGVLTLAPIFVSAQGTPPPGGSVKDRSWNAVSSSGFSVRFRTSWVWARRRCRVFRESCSPFKRNDRF